MSIHMKHNGKVPPPGDRRNRYAIAVAKLAWHCSDAGGNIICDLLYYRDSMDQICEGLAPLCSIMAAYTEDQLRVLMAKQMNNGRQLSLGQIAVLSSITSSQERQRVLRSTLDESLTVKEMLARVAKSSLDHQLRPKDLTDESIDDQLDAMLDALPHSGNVEYLGERLIAIYSALEEIEMLRPTTAK